MFKIITEYFDDNRAKLGLLALRLVIAADVLLSSFQKMIYSEIAVDHFASIYNLGQFAPSEMKIIGGAQMFLGLAILLGIQKRISYGLAGILQAIFIIFISPELISELKQFNLTLFPYVITLVGTFVLYTSRKHDKLLSL